MPMFVIRKLGIGEVRSTIITLQLANRSLIHHEGMIEDVWVKMDKFIFPANFVILDYEADREVLIILGRPFLTTRIILIYVQNGELTMMVQDEKVTFNVFKAMKYSDDLEYCSSVTLVDHLVSGKLEYKSSHEPLEQLILNVCEDKFDDADL